MEVSNTTVWQDCLEIVKESVDEQNFNTWFKPIVPIKHEGDVLTIQVPSQFFYEWLEENYVPVLKKAVSTVLGASGKLEYSVIVDSGNKKTPPLTVNYPNSNHGVKSNGQMVMNDKADYSPFSLKTVVSNPINARLNANYTFQNFVEGDCKPNTFAIVALCKSSIRKRSAAIVNI